MALSQYQVKKIKEAERNLKKCCWNNLRNFFKDDSYIFRDAFW